MRLILTLCLLGTIAFLVLAKRRSRQEYFVIYDDNGESLRAEEEAMIRSLIEDGYASKAVKLYSELNGVEIQEAMHAIDVLEKEMRSPKAAVSKAPTPPDLFSHSSDVADIRALAEEGKKIGNYSRG